MQLNIARIKYHKKKQVNILLKPMLKLDIGEKKEYRVKVIKNNIIYTKVRRNWLSQLYYLIN